MISIAEYNPKWPNQFQELKKIIWPKISSYAISLEHIGSTAVPGLQAKPIIDMDIVIEDMGRFDFIKKALKDLGYEHRGNMGIEGREAFRLGPVLYQHNLYVCTKDCFALKNHILLRDFLRSNESTKIKYGKLKLALAQKFADSIDDYVDGKSEFILKILKNQGMDSDHLKIIQANNKTPLNLHSAPKPCVPLVAITQCICSARSSTE